MVETMRTLLLSTCLALASAEDLRSRRIPDGLITFGMVGSLCLSTRLIDTVLGAFVGYTVFWLTRTITRRALGLGDVKLSMFVGSVIGPVDWWTAAMISAGTAGFVLLGAIALRAADRKTPLPFAPFLAVGGLTVWLGRGLAAVPCSVIPR
ncbi:MAG TPA: A24 family peptidase [Spirochaetia bacterium]|nr:A24 family peptidase [Spirochaetia bacterium]